MIHQHIAKNSSSFLYFFFCSSFNDFLYFPRVYIPIPSISTLLSAISFSLIIFDSTGSELFRINDASFTILFISSLGSFAKLILFKELDIRITNNNLNIRNEPEIETFDLYGER